MLILLTINIAIELVLFLTINSPLKHQSMLQKSKRKFSTFWKNFLKEQSLKRTLILALVSVFGYYSMYNVSGAANSGNAVTGAPFNSGVTCTDCHSSTNYASTVALQLMSGANVVTTYTPGQAYVLRITRSANATFNAIGAAGWGFQMACATGAGNTNNNGWGTLPSGVSNKLLSSRNYIEHNTKLAKTILTLDIPWTAPASGTAGTASFYIALNNVNGNASTNGDQVVTTSLAIPAASCPTPTVNIAANSSTICTGVSVTFTATPTNGGTTPTYQWKNNGTAITGATNATYTSTTLANGNLITCVMTPTAPCNTSSATSNTVTMTVNPLLTPVVSIAASSSTICSGANATFTATPTNGGGTPSYQWKKNGTNISGATASTYSSTTLANNDVISVNMTTSTTCYTAQTVTSNNVTMTVNQNLTPTVSITASNNIICSGTSVTFTATPTNGGGTPSYQWKKNGTNISGATTSTYTSTTFANNDVISVDMTTSTACYTAQTATSNNVTMTVNQNLTPTVSIAASINNICAGTSVTFTATPTNGGSTPGYQWKKNGTNISGATAATYSSSTIANNDVMSVVITTSIACYTAQTATSNNVTMTVNSILTPSVSIAASSNTICAGSSVIFTATPTNGGGTPLYQWKNNGTNISSATNATYSSSAIANGDVLSVNMTTSTACYTAPTASSNNVTMTVNQNLTPSVSIAASNNNICAGSSVTFTATPTNGGSTPSYQWVKNGTNISGATASTFSSSSLANGDVVGVMMTSSIACYTALTASSNNVTMVVNTNITPSVAIAASNNNVCAGASVSFTATPTNGGSTPTFQWYNNASAISGETNTTYNSSSLANGDVLSVIMGSSNTCSSTSTANSNNISMVVNPIVTPIVTAATTATTVCPGVVVTFNSNTTNGGNSTQFQWLLNGNNISGATNSSFSASSGVNDGDIYSVVITSNANCLSTNTATSNGVTMALSSPIATITPSGTTALCGTSNVTLTASNGASYLWSNGATTQSITANTSGSYSVAVTSFGGCVSNSTATNVQKFPTAAKILAVGLTSVCEPFTVSFKTDPTIGYVGQFNFQWNLGGAPISGATDSIYTASGASAGSVTLTLSGATCTSTSAGKTYAIKAKPSATFTAGGSTTFCTGGSVTLNAPVITGYTYAWLKDGLAAGAGNSKAFKLAGVYKVIAKLAGCADTSSTSATVVVNPLPIASVTNLNPNTFCAGDSCILSASPAGGNTYKWMVGTTVSATTTTNTYAVYASSTFKVVVTDSNGCTGKTSASSVKVTANLIPVALITPLSSTTISATGSVKLNASPSSGVSWQWFNNGVAISGATTKQYTATSGGSYTVAITKNACTGTSAATIVTQLPAKTNAGITSDDNFSIQSYPNPVNDLLTISINGVETIHAQLEMINYNGQLMGSWLLTSAQSTIDMSKYANGIYLIRYKDEEGRTGTLKVTKE